MDDLMTKEEAERYRQRERECKISFQVTNFVETSPDIKGLEEKIRQLGMPIDSIEQKEDLTLIKGKFQDYSYRIAIRPLKQNSHTTGEPEVVGTIFAYEIQIDNPKIDGFHKMLQDFYESFRK